MNVKRWAATVALCLVGILSLALLKGYQISQEIAFADAMPEHSESVAATYSRSLVFTEEITVLGDVVAPQSVALYSESAGRIVSVGFESGDTVAAGDVLIQQDISEEQALLAAARARLELAESVHRRHQKLYSKKAVSEEEYDRARVDLATIKADIARLESVIRKRTITAPFAGSVGIHQFEVGQFLLDNELVTQLLGNQDHLWVDFYLPQFYPLLEQGTTVQVGAIQSTGKDHWAAAKIIARSTQVDGNNRSYQYRAKVNRASFPAGVNSGVKLRIPVADAVATVAIPATAVQHDRLGQFVYLLQAEETSGAYRAQRQDVNVIARRDGLAYIDKGLEDHRLVASDGAFKLYPGLLTYRAAAEPLETDQSAPTDSEGAS